MGLARIASFVPNLDLPRLLGRAPIGILNFQKTYMASFSANVNIQLHRAAACISLATGVHRFGPLEGAVRGDTCRPSHVRLVRHWPSSILVMKL